MALSSRPLGGPKLQSRSQSLLSLSLSLSNGSRSKRKIAIAIALLLFCGAFRGNRLPMRPPTIPPAASRTKEADNDEEESFLAVQPSNQTAVKATTNANEVTMAKEAANETSNATEAAAKKTTIVSIPPSQMKVKYHEMWNHNTSTIRIPEEFRYPFGSNYQETSLEILQRVLHGEEHKKEYLAVEEYVNSAGRNYSTMDIPKCLVPDTKGTRRLADRIILQQQNLTLPVLNMGIPKCGSTTLWDYFRCIGLKSTHGQEGALMFKNAQNGQSPFSLRTHRSNEAWLQLDINRGTGYYPQISLLDEMHEFEPNSTFVMNFRPVLDWINSVVNWIDLRKRMSLFDMPGLIVTPEQRRIRYFTPDEQKKYNEVVGKGEYLKNMPLSKVQMAKWWCGHIKHIREYVKAYPSHNLIELDLYDTNKTSQVLYELFERNKNDGNDTDEDNPASSSSCWGHSNSNKRKTKKQAGE